MVKEFKLLVITLCSLMFCACYQQSQEKGYMISGTVDGATEGDTVLLCAMSGFFALNPLDTAIIENGKFVFCGHTDEVALRFLLPINSGDDGDGLAQLLLENANITVQMFPNDAERQAIVESDGPETPIYRAYEALMDEWNKKMEPSWDIVREQRGSSEEIATAQTELDSLSACMEKAVNSFIIEHLPSGVSDMLMMYSYEISDEEGKAEWLKIYAEKSPESYLYKKLLAQIEAAKHTEEGAEYVDFSMPDPSGKIISISDYVSKNKYTLVDFWASWCGPCRAEMPNVAEAYSKFHDKGLEIVGVSLDEEKNAWIESIKKLNMPWPQMSDLKGWESEGAAKYAIKAIPANLLIDQNGIVVAKNLREEALQEKLTELLEY